MAMKIKYALSNSTAPNTFTAWGTYDLADGPRIGTCKMTPAAGGVVNGTPPNFRRDGIWTSDLTGLVVRDVYQLDASYTPTGGGLVAAPAEINITIGTAVPVLPPPESQLPPPEQKG